MKNRGFIHCEIPLRPFVWVFIKISSFLKSHDVIAWPRFNRNLTGSDGLNILNMRIFKFSGCTLVRIDTLFSKFHKILLSRPFWFQSKIKIRHFWLIHNNKICWISLPWKLSVKSKSYTNLKWIKEKLRELARRMEKIQNGRRDIMETKFSQTEENDTGKCSLNNICEFSFKSVRLFWL